MLRFEARKRTSARGILILITGRLNQLAMALLADGRIILKPGTLTMLTKGQDKTNKIGIATTLTRDNDKKCMCIGVYKNAHSITNTLARSPLAPVSCLMPLLESQ